MGDVERTWAREEVMAGGIRVVIIGVLIQVEEGVDAMMGRKVVC